MKKKRTNRYVMTVHKGDTMGEYKLEGVRNAVKFVNKYLSKKLYVKLHGRFGEKNPNLHKYTGANGYINWRECRLEDAVRYDVYIYER